MFPNYFWHCIEMFKLDRLVLVCCSQIVRHTVKTVLVKSAFYKLISGFIHFCKKKLFSGSSWLR